MPILLANWLTFISGNFFNVLATTLFISSWSALKKTSKLKSSSSSLLNLGLMMFMQYMFFAVWWVPLAVDGVISDPSRWGSTTSGEHRTFHAKGDGTFTVDSGEVLDYRSLMGKWIPEGV